jgi:hypothetical protein
MGTDASAPRGGSPARLPILLTIASLAACGSVPAPEPQRTFDRVRFEQLYPITRDVFAAAGFKTSPCHAAAVCLETSWSWREYDGNGRDAIRLRERRMYSVRYERPPLHNDYMLFLDLVVQQRPAQGGDWIGKRVAPEDDPEYLQLLAELERAVWKFGGRDSRTFVSTTTTRSTRRTK